MGGYWISPLCSLDRRSASRSTCSALPPVTGGLLCLETSPSGEASASALVIPLRGLTPISRLFLSWRPCRSRSLIPSLAPSWWWPCPLLRWALLTRSGYVLSVPSAFSLRRSRWSIPSHCRPSRAVSLLTVSVIGGRFALAEGHLPMC